MVSEEQKKEYQDYVKEITPSILDRRNGLCDRTDP